MPKRNATQGRTARPRKAAAGAAAETRSESSAASTERASPIEVLLGTMRALWQSSRDAEGRVVDAKTAAAAASLAKDAAPYVHPRLATVDAPVENAFGRMSDAELEDRIRRLLPPADEAACAKD